MTLFTGKWSVAAKALATALAMVVAARATSLLATAANPYTLLWPVGGVALLCVYYWKRPALAGVLLGSLAYNISIDWQWFSLAGAQGARGFAGVSLSIIALASMVPAWLSARVLRLYMPALRDGSLSASGWLSMLLLAGPAACLLKVAMLAVALGWITLPLRSENIAFASAMWTSTTLAIWMAVPLIAIREVRAGMPRLAQNRLRNPWIALALVALPAWLLAAYAGAQQVAREQRRFVELGAEFRTEIQAALDLAEQKLGALRAYYRVSGDVPQNRFAEFADELLDRTPLLLGLDWTGRVTDGERARVEAALSAQQGRTVSLSEIDAGGRLFAAPRREEYWPLLRVAPAARQALLGLDLGSEAGRRNALDAAQRGGLTASSRPRAAQAGATAPVISLYLATEDPRGAVVASLDIDALLGEPQSGRQLLAQGHGLVLSNADGGVLAQIEPQPGALSRADPRLAQQFELKAGADTWHLGVTTAKAGLPYLSAPLWWFGQTLPQVLCVLVGLFMAMVAGSDRQIFQLERYYAGYVEDHHREVPRRVLTSHADAAIESAWNARAFEPQFEPIVDMRSGEIRGVEALLRWPDAPDGVVTSDVIDWAERHNLIGQLDHEMLAAALRAAADWPIARLPGFTISVNVSATDMHDPHWAGQLLRELARHRIPGRNLCVEITEGVLIRADDSVLSQLDALRTAGVRIALDDFGTGYSSIAYLRQLSVDRIKLDRVFVSDLTRDEKARRIVASILALGHTLGVDLVAEAVEDQDTARVLEALGCRLAQGRFYSDTLEAQAMRDLLVHQVKAQRVRA
ncbi:EAL domain-containing protein [Rudaea sp.]|uniref:sensor domain-containing phosphodiesterase n=1 Tax=Rudaea sp. TaxID=2136325 RepID=UPI00321FAD94